MFDRYFGPQLVSKAHRRFHAMIKPIGSTCNLSCTYCYYRSKARLLRGPGTGRMSKEVLEQVIRTYIESITGDEVVFTWQGGEPTLLGLDFFQNVVALERKYSKPGQRIENDLQTNGTLITDEWCEFLKENRFLVGLSIDGPREIHDRFRIAKSGEPSFEKVLNAARLLTQYRIPFNTLTCISRFNARRPLDVYRFLRREIGSTYLQFIPVVEYKGFEGTAPRMWNEATLPREGDPEARPGHPNSIVTEWSVDPEDWGYFLCKTFDEWLNRDVGKVLVNHFETLVAQHLGLPSQLCVYGEFCGRCVAVEHDGSVYSCDHYVYPAYRLGSIRDKHLGDLVFSQTQVEFGYAKNETLPQQCFRCSYLNDCWGECPKNRIIRTLDNEPGLNYLCPGFKKYFQHAIPHVDRIAARVWKQPMKQKRRMWWKS